MADWDTTWRPSFKVSFGPKYNTVITRFESGKEQRRSKWSSPRHLFSLPFAAREEATIQAIKEFQKARSGAYDTFNFCNYGEAIKGSALACTNDNPDTITDSGNSFVTQGFDASHGAWIAGSGQSNDGIYGVGTAAAGTLTLDIGESLSAESANASLEAFKQYTVRFAADNFKMQAVSNGIWACVVELVEVI